MSDMWWLKISCPLCPADQRGEPTFWPHTGCSKNHSSDNNLKIDTDGNLFCNGCHLKDPIINWNFGCGKHDCQKLTNLANLMEVLQVMINMSKNISDQKKFATMVANISIMFANK